MEEEKINENNNCEKDDIDSNDSDSSSDDTSNNDDAETMKIIEEMKARIVLNSKDSDAYSTLIATYRNQGDVEEVRAIRLQYKQNNPLSPDIWSEWIEDEIQMASDEEEKDSICHIFHAALRDYYSIDLWVKYIEFISSSFPDRMQEVAEEVIAACAADCAEGIRIWAVVLEWSKSNQTNEQTESFFSRMLSLPYQSLDGAYQQYVSWHESIKTDIDDAVTVNYNNSLKEYEKRSMYENELIASIELDHITTAYRHFNEYIIFEMKQQKQQFGTINRVVFLYEKFAFTFCSLSEFWHSYFLYSLDFIKTPKSTLSVSSRALCHITYCGLLVEDRILALEIGGKGVEMTTDVVNMAMKQNFATYYEYLQVLIAALTSHRRRAESGEKGWTQALEVFCGSCVDMLRDLNKEWYEGIYELQKSVTICYQTVLHNSILAYRIWEGIMHFHEHEFTYWNDFISFDRLYNQGNETRALFRRAASSVVDNTEYILSMWEEYERQFGTLETCNECSRKCRRYREILQDKQDQNNRKRESQEVVEGESKRVCVESEITSEVKSTPESSTKQKKIIKEKKIDLDVQKRTIFVNNLAFTATEEVLQQHFESYGDIEHVNVVRNSHGKSRGFAYVEFASTDSAEAALKEDGKELLKRKMEVKISIPQGERHIEKKETKEFNPTTIYVSGLPIDVSEYEFSVLFKICGNVVASRIIRDKLTKIGKGTGLLQFGDEESVEKALKMDGDTWRDQVIHVRRSKYPVK